MGTIPANPGGRTRRWLRALLGGAALLALAAWLSTTVYTVAPTERGVVTRFGRVYAKVLPGIGFKLPWPIDRVHKLATTDVKRIEVGFRLLGKLSNEPRRSDALTGDENILKVMMGVQYKIRDPRDYLFAADEPKWLVERAVEWALNREIAARTVDEILTTGKDEIQVRAIEGAQQLLDGYKSGVALLGGSLQSVDPPQLVSEAFKEVASAKKDAERAIDEAREFESKVMPQAKGAAQQLVSEAQGQAVVRVNEARGQANRFQSLLGEYQRAPQVTRTRLFLETMEQVLSQMRVVVVDESSGKVTVFE